MAGTAASAPVYGATMEGRLVGGGPDRGDADLPVFDADAVPASGRSHLRPPASGRRPGRARGVWPAVGALVVLTAGVAIGGALESPKPSSSSVPPSASPTLVAALCGPVGTESVPSFGLRIANTTLSYPGLVGYTRRPGWESERVGWRVPAWDDERRPFDSTAEWSITTPGNACLRYLIAEYAEANIEGSPTAEDRHAIRDEEVEPASPSPSLGTLPDGDWVLRVVAYFETGIEGPSGLVISEAFFRIRIGDGPFPTPTPVVTPRPAATPEVACGPEPASPGEVEVLASTPATPNGVAGAHGDANLPVVTVAVGDPIELRTNGDVCAISWSIRALDPTTGEVMNRIVRDNPTGDPTLAIEDRWRMEVPIGDSRLVADLQLVSGASIVRQWAIHGLPFTVPTATLTGSNGRRVEALPGCGLTIFLANGYDSSENCGSLAIPDDLDVLHVPAWSMVVFEVPNWLIRTWDGSCGGVEASEGQEYFAPTDGCYVGGGNAPAGMPSVRFLARPGERMLQLSVTAVAAGSSFSVPLYVVVVGE